MSKDNYGYAATPSVSSVVSKLDKQGNQSYGNYASLSKEIEELKNQLAKQNRDNLDAMYNITSDNLSKELKEEIDEGGLSSAQENAINNLINYSYTDVNGVSHTGTSGLFSSVNDSYSITGLMSEYKGTNDSIAAILIKAINGGESSIKISADKVNVDGSSITLTADQLDLIAERVNLSGYVTFSELSASGSSSFINGNNITLSQEVDSVADSKLNFYLKKNNATSNMASIYTITQNIDSTSSYSAYSLNISTETTRSDVKYTHPAIKITGDGGVSISSLYKGVYIKASGLSENVDGYSSDYGYIVLDAAGNTRIRAKKSSSETNGYAYPANNDYVFCTDGIYYNGTKVLSV